MTNYKFKFWHYGLVVTVVAAVLITYNLEASDKTYFLSGEATHGHHQIELACTSCHSDGFSGQDVIQQACVNCHQDELIEADDSHPRKKFLDPRNAGLLAHLDARLCVTCHTEHKPQITQEMGVTLAGDFCFHCHKDIAENRPNHAEFGFETCASAGCHNYHDNRYLYEEFLAERIDVADILIDGQLPVRSMVSQWENSAEKTKPLSIEDADFTAPESHEPFPADITHAWAASMHAEADTNCSDCHSGNKTTFTSPEVVEMCGSCHTDQREQFSQGKHGMRLSENLPEAFVEKIGAMSVSEARLPMKEHSSKELNCTSCHSPHETDVRFAAVEACLGCHNDEHSLAFKQSSHFQAWEAGEPGGVSCANCHLPREEHDGKVFVNHNQNHNLRPNEKMLPVCLNCHGVEFSVAALSNKELHNNNFSSPPTDHETFELIRERIARIKRKK